VTSRLTRSLLSLGVATGLCAGVLAGTPAAASPGHSPGRAAAADAALARVAPGPPVVITAGPGKGRSTVPAPELQTAPLGRSSLTVAGADSSAVATSTIVVNYTGFTAEARVAFQSAVDVLETLITAPVPIVVDASWAPLGTTVLGSAGPTWLTPRTVGGVTSYYPYGLANQLAGVDLDPAESDVRARFSSTYTAWYMGTDGLTPSNRIDFPSVVMHEVMHGLGFVGGMEYSGGTGSWGPTIPFVYDRHAATTSGTSLLSTTAFPNPSTTLGSALVGGRLQTVGPYARRGNGGVAPRLYAPSVWSGGSSYSHLDESTFPAGTPNSLMTYQIGPGEAIHSPGPVALGMLRDMGWDALVVPAAPTGVTATAGGGSATVSWIPPADDGGSPVASQRVIPSVGAPVTVSGSASSAVVTGLTADSPVTFTVVAVNGLGDSPPSARSAAVTPTSAAPADTAPPVLVELDVTPRTVDLASAAYPEVSVTARITDATDVEWTPFAFSSDRNRLAGVLERTSGSAQDGTYTGTVTVQPDAPLGTYTLGLSPLLDTLGNAGPAGPPPGFPTTLTVSDSRRTVPEAPHDVAATALPSAAQVSWSPAWPNAGPVTSYTVTTAPSGQTTVTSGTSVIVSDLSPGESYSFTVTATNEFGTSDHSWTSSVVVPLPGTCLSGFVDVPADHPFCEQIRWMKTAGVSTGTVLPDGTAEYRPALSVSRLAMAPFLYRALGSPAFIVPAVATFADVPPGHPFFAEIEWMAARGISTGTAQPTGRPLYKPAEPVSRSAMALFLQRAAGSPASTLPLEPSFADVPATHPAYAAIEWMRAAGISTGTAQTTGPPLYKPADPVSRQAMAAFLQRFDTLLGPGT